MGRWSGVSECLTLSVSLSCMLFVKDRVFKAFLWNEVHSYLSSECVFCLFVFEMILLSCTSAARLPPSAIEYLLLRIPKYLMNEMSRFHAALTLITALFQNIQISTAIPEYIQLNISKTPWKQETNLTKHYSFAIPYHTELMAESMLYIYLSWDNT